MRARRLPILHLVGLTARNRRVLGVQQRSPLPLPHHTISVLSSGPYAFNQFLSCFFRAVVEPGIEYGFLNKQNVKQVLGCTCYQRSRDSSHRVFRPRSCRAGGPTLSNINTTVRTPFFALVSIIDSACFV